MFLQKVFVFFQKRILLSTCSEEKNISEKIYKFYRKYR